MTWSFWTQTCSVQIFLTVLNLFYHANLFHLPLDTQLHRRYKEKKKLKNRDVETILSNNMPYKQ